MLSLIQAAGWPIWPIIFASIVAVAIIGKVPLVLALCVSFPKRIITQGAK